jgi:hypothetical protein
VTETVIAAVSLLHEWSVDEIAGKLTPAELVDVTRLVSRCPSCYPPGAYDALKAKRNLALPAPSPQNLPPTLAAKERTTPTRVGFGADHLVRIHKRTHARFSPHAVRRARLSQYRAANAEKTGTHTGTLADVLRRRMVVEDLRGLGLSIRGIAAATGIPRSSVHRAVRAMARARAKQEADTIEIMNKLLGKKLSR